MTLSTLSMLDQGTHQDQPNSNRLIELLRHPTFITLRLSTPIHRLEKPTDSPKPYYEGALLRFELFMTQNSTESITIWSEMDPYYQYRPELMRDGDILAYSKEAREGVQKADTQPDNGSGAPLLMKPGREYPVSPINLDDWYKPLQPGRYQLIVRKRFVWDGDWVQTNPILFDVLPRKLPDAIPENVVVRLAPDGVQPQSNERHYRLGSDAIVTISVVNNSGKTVRWNVLDHYYRNRLELFRDGESIPYRKETAERLRTGDENPYRMETGPDFFMEPNTICCSVGIRLSEWFGPLAPGMYRLINRHRFEINGPWTAESAPLLFQIPAR